MGSRSAAWTYVFASITLVVAVAAESGTATFYTPPYIPTACYGYSKSQFPAGNLFAAASKALWNGGGACGKEFKVSCTGGTNSGTAQPCLGGNVTVKIVDMCPPPDCRGTLDLSADAFAVIANPNEGKITINYQEA